LLGPVEGSEGRAYRWHPSKPLIAYNVAHPPTFSETTEWVVADVSGAEPSAPVVVPVAGDFDRWLPDGKLLMLNKPDHTQLSLVDIDTKPPTVVELAPQKVSIGFEQLSPDGNVLGMSMAGMLYFADLKAPMAAPVAVKSGGDADTIPYFVWTEDGQYLVMDVSSDKFTKASVKLARIDGQKLSPFVTIMEPRTNQGFGWSLQPRP